MKGGNAVSVQKTSVTLIDDIINNASTLPLECQDLLLSIAKGMAFTKNCIAREQLKSEEQKTA